MPNHAPESPRISDLLEQARIGDQQSLDLLLQWSRTFLREEVRSTLAPQLRVRVDESDLVQKVCLAAFEQFAQFRGVTHAEYAQWLRRVLQRDILEVVERERLAAKRAIDREEPGTAPVRNAVGRQTSPSRRAICSEERRIVLEAVEQLPDSQREVVQLRHLKQLSLRETATRLGKTEDAVVGLLKRGILKLNEILRNRGLNDVEDQR